MGLKEQRKLINRGKTLLARDMNIKDIAKELHISRKRAYDLLYLSDESALRKLEEAKKLRDKFRDDRDRKIWELRARGNTLREISELIGISTTTIRHTLYENKSKADKLTKEIVNAEKFKIETLKEKAFELKSQGLQNIEIAKELKKSASWVQMIFGEMPRQHPRKITKKGRAHLAAEARKLMAEGYNKVEIQEKLGRSRDQVYLALKEADERERQAFDGKRGQFKKLKERERRDWVAAMKRRKQKVQEEKQREIEEKRKNSKPPAIGYCRVSTEEQVKQGVSLEFQKEEIRAYVERNGYELTDILTDEGVSGSNYDRPAFQELLRRGRNGEFNTVVVWMLDRLMRGFYDQLRMIKEVFEPFDIEIKSTAQELDRSTPVGRLIFGILGLTGEFERETIIQRAKTTSRHLWDKGIWKAPAAVPLGFRLRDDGKLEEDAREMRTIERVLKLVKENEGRLHTDPDFMDHSAIGRKCGISKNAVYRLKSIGLKGYKAKYEKFMAKGENDKA